MYLAIYIVKILEIFSTSFQISILQDPTGACVQFFYFFIFLFFILNLVLVLEIVELEHFW